MPEVQNVRLTFPCGNVQILTVYEFAPNVIWAALIHADLCSIQGTYVSEIFQREILSPVGAKGTG